MKSGQLGLKSAAITFPGVRTLGVPIFREFVGNRNLILSAVKAEATEHEKVWIVYFHTKNPSDTSFFF